MDNPQSWIELISGAGFPVALILLYVIKIRPDDVKRAAEREAADRQIFKDALRDVVDTCREHIRAFVESTDRSFNVLSQNIRDNTEQMRQAYSRREEVESGYNNRNGAQHE